MKLAVLSGFPVRGGSLVREGLSWIAPPPPVRGGSLVRKSLTWIAPQTNRAEPAAPAATGLRFGEELDKQGEGGGSGRCGPPGDGGGDAH